MKLEGSGSHSHIMYCFKMHTFTNFKNEIYANSHDLAKDVNSIMTLNSQLVSGFFLQALMMNALMSQQVEECLASQC